VYLPATMYSPVDRPFVSARDQYEAYFLNYSCTVWVFFKVLPYAELVFLHDRVKILPFPKEPDHYWSSLCQIGHWLFNVAKSNIVEGFFLIVEGYQP